MRNGHEIAKLIEPGHVHRSVYTDPDLFEPRDGRRQHASRRCRSISSSNRSGSV